MGLSAFPLALAGSCCSAQEDAAARLVPASAAGAPPVLPLLNFSCPQGTALGNDFDGSQLHLKAS